MFNAKQNMNTHNCTRYFGGQKYNQKTVSNTEEKITFMEEI